MVSSETQVSNELFSHNFFSSGPDGLSSLELQKGSNSSAPISVLSCDSNQAWRAFTKSFSTGFRTNSILAPCP